MNFTWRELLSTKYSDLEFYDGIADEQIRFAEAKMGVEIPSDLKALYFQTNGVYANDAYMWLVFSVEKLVKENVYMRTSPEVAFYERSFNDLLFFGELGNGDFVAFRMDPDQPASQSVGIWDHEDGEYREYAVSLREYMER